MTKFIDLLYKIGLKRAYSLINETKAINKHLVNFNSFVRYSFQPSWL